MVSCGGRRKREERRRRRAEEAGGEFGVRGDSGILRMEI